MGVLTVYKRAKVPFLVLTEHELDPKHLNLLSSGNHEGRET